MPMSPLSKWRRVFMKNKDTAHILLATMIFLHQEIDEFLLY